MCLQGAVEVRSRGLQVAPGGGQETTRSRRHDLDPRPRQRGRALLQPRDETLGALKVTEGDHRLGVVAVEPVGCRLAGMIEGDDFVATRQLTVGFAMVAG